MSEIIIQGGRRLEGTVRVQGAKNSVLPVLAKRIGFDPAVMASPFITTIVDALSLLIYFGFANLILPMG